MSTGDEKLRLCVVCGHDCTGMPRIKDRKGRYMHRACYAEVKPDPAAKPASALEALLVGVEEPSAGAATRPCENCGMPRPAESAACAACKYDDALGRVPKERKLSRREQRDAEAAAAASRAAELPANRMPRSIGAAVSSVRMADEAKRGTAVSAWMMSALGAGIAASLCAFAWAGVIYWTGWELPIAALGVGFVVGLGAVIGVRSHAGFMSGLIGGVMTLAAVFGGKYLAAAWIVDDFVQAVAPMSNSVFMQPLDPYNGWMTDEQALAYDVDHECRKLEYRGQALDWPTPADPASATDLDWYPRDVVDRCRARWAAMTPEQADYAKYELVREECGVYLSAEIAPGFERRGVSMDYPRQHTADTAYFIEDYPLEVQSTVEMRWSGMSPEQVVAYHAEQVGAEGWMNAETKADMAMSLMLANERPEAYQHVASVITGVESPTGSVKGWAAGVFFIGCSFFVGWIVGSGGKN